MTLQRLLVSRCSASCSVLHLCICMVVAVCAGANASTPFLSWRMLDSRVVPAFQWTSSSLTILDPTLQLNWKPIVISSRGNFCNDHSLTTRSENRLSGRQISASSIELNTSNKTSYIPRLKLEQIQQQEIKAQIISIVRGLEAGLQKYKNRANIFIAKSYNCKVEAAKPFLI